MVQEALPNWQSAQADVLLTVMQKKPELWGIRFGGRRGVAFINQKSPTLLARLFGNTRKTARVGVRWEDGTSTDLHPDQTVEWCLMFFPASG